jgi:hypothetical protein
MRRAVAISISSNVYRSSSGYSFSGKHILVASNYGLWMVVSTPDVRRGTHKPYEWQRMQISREEKLKNGV